VGEEVAVRIVGRRDLRDYFDHVGHRYGQDPAVTYERAPLRPVEGEPRPGYLHLGDRGVTRAVPAEVANALRLDSSKTRGAGGNYLSLVVAARWAFYAVEIDRYGPSPALVLARELSDSGDPRTELPERALHTLIRAVGVPVFRVVAAGPVSWARPSDGHYVELDRRVPHLGALGVAAFVPAEQMWQEVYATCSNVLRADPDRAPPTEIANDDRVEAAGFDLKTSFRGPARAPRRGGRR
jgi:hypothetical protein